MKKLIKLVANIIEYCVCSNSQSDNDFPNPKCLKCGKELP